MRAAAQHRFWGKLLRAALFLAIGSSVVFLFWPSCGHSGNAGKSSDSLASDSAGAESFRVHGRLYVDVGTPSCRIWVVGTGRILGIYEFEAGKECPVPPELLKILKEDVNDRCIYADFVVTPLASRREGVMQPVKLERAENIVVTTRSMQFLRRVPGVVK
jgi:hypothetical protein